MPETQQKEVMKDYLDFRGAADKSYPAPPRPRDGEQFRSFWLLFPSTLFSFLLLMGLIIFSEKTHDLGRGVTAGGHWAPAGAACVCVCLRVFACVCVCGSGCSERPRVPRGSPVSAAGAQLVTDFAGSLGLARLIQVL